MAYRDVILADSPLDYYEMETAAGTDTGSGGRTATLANVVTGLGVANTLGWSFNGLNAMATMGTFPSITTNFSLEIWFKSNGANGWTNDYPTFIRRDGTDIILIRGRNSSFAAGTNPGRAELYISSGISIVSPLRYDDGNWHHAVATVAGNAVKFYVDGVLVGSATASKSTHNFGTGAAYIGGNSALGAEYYQGMLDNAAIYGTALSQNRVAEHFESALTVKNSIAVTDDAYVSSQSGQTNTNSGTSGFLLAATSLRTYIKLPTVPAGVTPIGARLKLVRQSATTAGNLTVSAVSTTWSETSVTWGNKPALISPVTFADPGGAAGTAFYIPLEAFIGSENGIAIDVASGNGNQYNWYSSEDTTVANRPVYEVMVHMVPDASIVIDVDTQTISASAVEPSKIVEGYGTKVDLTTATASTVAYDAKVESVSAFTPSRDWYYTSEGNTSDTTSLIANGAGGGYALTQSVIDFEVPSTIDPENMMTAVLALNATYVAGAVRIRKIVSEYTTNATGAGLTLSTNYIDITPAMGINNIDVMEFMTDGTNFFGFHIGPVDVNSSNGANFTSSNSGTNAPKLTIRSSVIGRIRVDVGSAWVSLGAHNLNLDAEFDAQTATATVFTQDANFSGSTAVDADLATVEFLASDVTVDSTESPNVIVDADTVTPVLVKANEAEFVYSESVTVDSAAINADSIEIDSVVTKASAIIDVDAPRIRAVALAPTDVQGEPILPSEGEDNYFDSTWNTFGGATYGLTGNTQTPVAPETALWYRMNERSGETISDRAWVYRNDAGDIVPSPGIESGKAPALNLHGVVIGQNNGPDGRHNFSFTGYSYIDGAGGGIGGLNNNIEFTMRTTRGTQFIMGGGWLGAGTINNPPMQPWELWMVDGVLEIRQAQLYSQNGLPTNRVISVTKMRTRLDDGAWHHVVIQRAANSVDERSIGAERYFQFESYIDGKLETRRRVGNIAFAFPQFIGGRPNNYYKSGAWTVSGDNLSPEQWFKGDLTELVYRYNDNLVEDEVTRQRDNVMNIDVYRAEPARVTFQNEDAEVRGNKARVLVLDFGGYVGRTQYPGTDPMSRLVGFPVGQDAKNMGDKMLFADAPGIVYADFPGYGEVHTAFYSSEQTGMTQWFRKDVRQKMDADGNVTNETYNDEVTDNYRLIDLEKDLNMDDYDLISIIGFPQNETMFARFADMDFKNLAPFTPAKVQIENLLKQVRDQVVNNRKSLYITDPFSAIALGIIDDVDAVPKFQEKYVADQRVGANTGDIDWHAFITDPFGTAAAGGYVIPRPLWGFDPRNPLRENANKKLAAQYEDMHANIRQTVRNIVPGLTSNFGWIKTDDLVWWNINPMANPPFQRSIRYEDKRGPSGLSIGDQFYLAGEHIFDWGFGSSFYEANAIERRFGYVAAPMSAIKVGKAVTTFAPTIAAHGDHEAVDNMSPEDMMEGKFYDMPIGNVFGDHAVSIAVEPGDLWDGEYVSGKVYINFTEFNVWNPEHLQTSQIMKFATRFPNEDPRQVISLGETINTGYNSSFEVTVDMLRYQWSTHYGSYQGSQIPLPEGGKTADWGWSAGGVRGEGGFSTYGAGQAMSWGWSPATKFEVIETPTMYQKGFRWLLDDLDVAGVVNASVETAVVNTNANDVTVDTVQNSVVDVPTTRITVESYDDADTISPNISVLVGTPEIEVKVIGLVEYIDLDTPTISLEVPVLGAGETVVDWNDALIFTLPRQYITLTMEEG